jgi:hypothetical protein
LIIPRSTGLFLRAKETLSKPDLKDYNCMWLALKSVQYVYSFDTLSMSSATEPPIKIGLSGIFNLPTTELRFVMRPIIQSPPRGGGGSKSPSRAPSGALYADKRFRFREDEGLVGPRVNVVKKKARCYSCCSRD